MSTSSNAVRPAEIRKKKIISKTYFFLPANKWKSPCT
jgi:hypothetical protein